jgi:adenine-specific DNA-methyltransferase
LGTIADIGEQRLRHVTAVLEKELRKRPAAEQQGPQDLGFRVLRLAESHFNAWKDYEGGDTRELETLFDHFESPLVEGWKPENLLGEVILLQGFPLDSTITRLPEHRANRVWRVSSDLVAYCLYVCLDAELKPQTASQLQMGAEDVFVCLDSALDEETKLRLQDGRNVMVI